MGHRYCDLGDHIEAGASSLGDLVFSSHKYSEYSRNSEVLRRS